MSQPVLLFLAGGVRCGVGLADVSRLLVEDTLIPVPFSHPAMAGLVDAGADGAVPVFDLKGLVDPADIARKAPGATVALFPTAKGPVGLRLDELHGTAATYEPYSEGVEVPEALRMTVTGAAQVQGKAFAFFSPDAFLAAVGL